MILKKKLTKGKKEKGEKEKREKGKREKGKKIYKRKRGTMKTRKVKHRGVQEKEYHVDLPDGWVVGAAGRAPGARGWGWGGGRRSGRRG